MSAAGNITGNYFVGNGSQLTGVLATGIGTLASLSVTGNTDTGNLRTAGQVSATGNVTGDNFVGNGQYLSSITGANVTGTVANATFATSAGTATTAGSANTAVTVTGNAQANITSVGVLTSLSSTGNIDGANINGNGSGLSSITGANVTGTVANATYATSAGSATTAGSANTAATVTGNAQANITSVGILTSLSVSGNVTANYFIGNGSQLTGITSSYGNANVAANLAAFGSNPISTSGNVTAGYFVGNGSLLSNIAAANITGNVATANSAVFLTASTNSAVNMSINAANSYINLPGGGLIGFGGDPAFDPLTVGSVDILAPQTYLANSYVSFTWANTANVLADPVNVTQVSKSGIQMFYDAYNTGKNLAVGASGVTTSTTISAAGNITAPYFIGNGSQLTGITTTYGNANVAANLAAFGSNPISTTGNVTAGYFVGNGSLLSNITAANVTGNVATANSAVFLKASTNAAVNMSIDAGNFQINLPGGSIINYGGDGDPNTIGSINLIGAQANLANTYAQLTFVNQANFFANPLNAMRVSNAGPFMFYDGLSSFGGAKTLSLNSAGLSTNAAFSATGNVTGGNILTGGIVSATGNVLGGNLIVTGNIIDTGALTISTGSNGNIALTPNGTGQVTASSAISATGNITGNYFIGNGSALTGITATSANSAVYLRDASNAAVFMNVDNANTRIAIPGGGFIGYGGYDAPTFGSIDISAPQANIANSYVAFSHFSANASATPVNVCQVDIAGIGAFYDTYGEHGGFKGFRLGSSGFEVQTTISATGNITGASIRTAGSVSATGNVLGGNLIVTGNIIDTGALTISTGSNGNIALTPNGTGQVTASSAISATGNITGGNIITVGAVSTTGRVIGVNYTESVNAIGNSGGTVTPNISLGSIQSITLTSNMTFNSITNIQAGQSFTFVVTQDATGSRTLTSSMLYAGGSKTLSTAAGAVDIISVFYNGTTYYASLTKGYS